VAALPGVCRAAGVHVNGGSKGEGSVGATAMQPQNVDIRANRGDRSTFYGL
jgi:hypothetical protein